MTNEQKKLYRMMQTYAFVLQETALYLDSHPNCRSALSYFRKYNTRLAEITSQYEMKYGPVTIYGQNCDENWKWIDGPWPWEYVPDTCRS